MGIWPFVSRTISLKVFQLHCKRVISDRKHDTVTFLEMFLVRTITGSPESTFLMGKVWSRLTTLYKRHGICPALTSVPLFDFFDVLKWNPISSLMTMAWPDEPQSEDGPLIHAQATYHLLACKVIKTVKSFILKMSKQRPTAFHWLYFIAFEKKGVINSTRIFVIWPKLQSLCWYVSFASCSPSVHIKFKLWQTKLPCCSFTLKYLYNEPLKPTYTSTSYTLMFQIS